MLLLAFFVSCSNDSKELISNDECLETTYQENYSLLLGEVDKLNDEFGYCNTRGVGTDIVKRTADLAGSQLGAWVGSELGAGLGVLTANPVVGVVGYLGGRKVGGVAGFVVASYIAGKLCETIKGSCDLDETGISFYGDMYDGYSTGVIYTRSDEDPSVYSVGDIHNMILAKLVHNNKAYTDKDGHLQIEEMYDDAVQLEMAILDDTLSLNTVYRNYFIAFCKDVESATRDLYANGICVEEYNARLFQSLMNKGVPAADVQELEELTNKLLAPTVLDREQTFEYERAFEDIVRTSSLPDNKKEDFILSGSVAIMSTDFWKSKQQSN